MSTMSTMTTMSCTIAIASIVMLADDQTAWAEAPAVQAPSQAPAPAQASPAEASTPGGPSTNAVPPFKLDLSAPPVLVISTDRPGFSTGTGIVPQGHLQLENGFTFVTDHADGMRSSSETGPQMLLRVGLIEDLLEFRASWQGYTWTQSREESGARLNDNGWNDVILGAKLRVLEQNKWIPRIALLAQTTIGGGEEPVATQEIEPLFGLLASYDFGNGLSLVSNLNLAFPTEDGSHFEQGQASLALWFPIVDRVTGFIETYTLFPNSRGGHEAWYLNLGGTWLLDDRVQLDAGIGIGLDKDADDFSASIGISFLF